MSLTANLGRRDGGRGGDMATAMLGAAGITAQFVAGKAARDALFLAHLDVTSLPLMVMATSVFSIFFAGVSSTALRRVSPATFVPLAFAFNAVLFVGLWGLVAAAPRLGASLVFLQVSGFGPLLGSGFWLVVTERFDPRTAKRTFGRIGAAGTLGGLLGGLAAERVAEMAGLVATLPMLAAIGLFTAAQVRRLATPMDRPGRVRAFELSPDLAPDPARSGFRVLADAPYLRNLAVMVLLGTMSAALVDYLFKAQAVAAFGRGEGLLRFFAAYYAVVGLITFVLQTSAARIALERLGLALTTSAPSLALLAGGAGAWLAPGLGSTMVARGGESAFRGSLFRAGYELFYTPVPAAEKRAAKSLIDVGFDRLGEALGGGAVRALFLLPVAGQYGAIIAVALVTAVGALVAASRLNRGYIETLERSLLDRAVDLDLKNVEDLTTRMALLKTTTTSRPPRSAAWPREAAPGSAGLGFGGATGNLDTDLQLILALRSKDRDRVAAVLRADQLPATVVPHVIALVAWDPLAAEAITALRRVAEEHTGQLIDRLIDPSTEFVVRRRLARAMSVCVSQRAVDGLLRGLDDPRFEVRYWCAWSIAAIAQRNPAIKVPSETVLEAVRREVAVGRPIWQANRLLERAEEDDPDTLGADQVVGDRASRSLAHVFTLLSLVLPVEPMRIAFQALQTSDAALRGTALEYLEGVLPPSIRAPLWPFLEDRRAAPGVMRPREEVLADLMRSNESIALNLKEIRRRLRASEDNA